MAHDQLPGSAATEKCSRCHRPAKHRGVYTERPSAQSGQVRLFCGLHATTRMASEGWSFTALTKGGSDA